VKKPARTPLLAALSLAAALTAGCSPGFDRLDMSELTDPPLPATLLYERVEIAEGIAVGFIAAPMADGKELDEDISLDLTSEAPGVVGVAPSINPRTFVIYGVSRGSGSISVVLEGEVRGTIPVTVTPQ
jgi:hypothetical protein